MKLRHTLAVLIVGAMGCGSEQPPQVEAGQPNTPTASGEATLSDYVSEAQVPETLTKSLSVPPGPTSADELTFIAKQESDDSVLLVEIDPKTGESAEAIGPNPSGWLTQESMLASPQWLAIGATVCSERPFEGDTGLECSGVGKQVIFVRDNAGAWREAVVPATSNPYLLRLSDDEIVWDSVDGTYATRLADLNSRKLGASLALDDNNLLCRSLSPDVKVSLNSEKFAAEISRASGEEDFALDPALDGWESDAGLLPPACYGSGETLLLSGIEGAIPPPGLVPDAELGEPITDTIDRPDSGGLVQSRPAQMVDLGSGETTDLPFTSLSSSAATGGWVLADGTFFGQSKLWLLGPDGAIEFDGWTAPSSLMASGTGAISVEYGDSGSISSIKVIDLDN